MMTSDIVLNHQQIKDKIKRLAWQIYENNMDARFIWVAGIDDRGNFLAGLISDELKKICDKEIKSLHLVIDRLNYEPSFFSEFDLSELKDSDVVLVDDVLNTGKTICGAMLPLFRRQVAKLQLAVLASRNHRLYPVQPDFVGISMATTLQEHLRFDMSDVDNLSLSLT